MKSAHEVAVVHEQQPGALVVQSETATVLSIIERVAMNPDADIEKMERLLVMHERMQSKQAEAAYNAALSEMQPDLPVIAERGAIKNKSGGIQSTYALWEDINEAIKPILARHGFALSFRTDCSAGVKVVGVLSHRQGHKETTDILLAPDMSGSKNAVQAVASSISYGKRYTAGALLNLTSRGEDDDGNLGEDPAQRQDNRQQAAQRPQAYSEEDFKTNFPAWAEKLKAGTNTADRIIALVESKGRPLSDDQKNALRNVKGPQK